MNTATARALALVAFALALAPEVRAETTACTNITSLPTVITTQGVYCLKQDLATAITDGAAIQIATNNVTLDCNDHKVGNLAAGPATQAVGVQALGRSNITVRNCNLRGFRVGIALGGVVSAPPSGLLVERNRVDMGTQSGIVVKGVASVVRNNTVADTGGGTYTVGISAAFGTDVIGNTLDGLIGAGGVNVIGIDISQSTGTVVEGNQVRNIVAFPESTGVLVGVATGVVVRGNTLGTQGGSAGVVCVQPGNVVSDTTSFGFAQVMSGCIDGGRNLRGDAP